MCARAFTPCAALALASLERKSESQHQIFEILILCGRHLRLSCDWWHDVLHRLQSLPSSKTRGQLRAFQQDRPDGAVLLPRLTGKRVGMAQHVAMVLSREWGETAGSR